MKIIYPNKSCSDVKRDIQNYENAHDKSLKFPTWWVSISILWTIFNACLILIALGLVYHIMSNAPYIRFEFMGYNENFMTALFIVVLGLHAALLTSGMAKKLLRGLIFPESKKADDYFSVQKRLMELLGEYENAEQLKKMNRHAYPSSYQAKNPQQDLTKVIFAFRQYLMVLRRIFAL